MELITPKCIGGKQCYSVCNAKGCSNKPFMCVDGCQCQQSHKLCFLSIKWKIIKQIFSKKLIKPSVQTKNYLSQVEEIYKSILKQVQISYNEMRNLQYTFGLNQVQKNIFTKVCSHQTSQLTGNLMSYIQLKYVPSQITIIDELIQERRKQINKQTEILLNMVSNLTTYKSAFNWFHYSQRRQKNVIYCSGHRKMTFKSTNFIKSVTVSNIPSPQSKQSSIRLLEDTHRSHGINQSIINIKQIVTCSHLYFH